MRTSFTRTNPAAPGPLRSAYQSPCCAVTVHRGVPLQCRDFRRFEFRLAYTSTVGLITTPEISADARSAARSAENNPIRIERITPVPPVLSPRGSKRLSMRASGSSTDVASTCPISSPSRQLKPRSATASPASSSVQAKAIRTLPSSGRRASSSARVAGQPCQVRFRRLAGGVLGLAVPHEHHQVTQRLVHEGLSLDDALQHHGIAARVQKASQPTIVLALAPGSGLGVSCRSGTKRSRAIASQRSRAGSKSGR